jgi:hypothetical protein
MVRQAARTWNGTNVEENMAGHNDARVVVQELSLDAWHLMRPITFTLVDANGVALTNMVKMTDVATRGGEPEAYRALNATTMTGGTGGDARAANTRANMTVVGQQRNWEFNFDGTSITYWGHSRTGVGADRQDADRTRLVQSFRFNISANPDFSGDVFVAVTGSAVDGLIVGSNQVKIHEIQPRIEVKAETTIVGIGQQTIAVGNITMS